MPRNAWSAKRERQYEHIKKDEKKCGRSEHTAERIAAATVTRTHPANGENKAPRAAEGRAGRPHPAAVRTGVASRP